MSLLGIYLVLCPHVAARTRWSFKLLSVLTRSRLYFCVSLFIFVLPFYLLVMMPRVWLSQTGITGWFVSYFVLWYKYLTCMLFVYFAIKVLILCYSLKFMTSLSDKSLNTLYCSIVNKHILHKYNHNLTAGALLLHL